MNESSKVTPLGLAPDFPKHTILRWERFPARNTLAYRGGAPVRVKKCLLPCIPDSDDNLKLKLSGQKTGACAIKRSTLAVYKAVK